MEEAAPHRRGDGGAVAGLVVVLVLVVAAVAGAVVAAGAHDRSGAVLTSASGYAEVQAAAAAHAEAWVNVAYDDPASVERLLAGATGGLADRYADTGPVLRDLRRRRAVATGTVVEVGVVSLAADAATVLAATDGTLATRASRGLPQQRDARLRLRLVREDGRWLTSAVEVLD